ncbi:CMT1A duplicated region transcript 4 protein [Trichinella pseudospiralis]
MEKNLTNNEERWRLYANWEQEACNKLLRKMRKRNFFLCASLVNQPWKADKSVILAFVVPSQRKSKETRPKEAWQFDSLDESSWPTSECCPRRVF